MKIENLTIDNAEAFANQRYEGVIFNWSANIGFGELTIYRENGTNEWKADTEHMCEDNDKDFLQMVLDEWIDNIKITE